MSKTKDLQAKGDTPQAKEDIQAPVVRKRGRPPGAKNKDTLFKELMTGQFQETAQEHIQRTFQVLFEKAHEGDMKAIKLVLDRVVPVTKAVDLADMEKKGLTVSINIGKMAANANGEVYEAEYEVVEED